MYSILVITRHVLIFHLCYVNVGRFPPFLKVTQTVRVSRGKALRPLGRPRHRWVDNIRLDLQEVGCGYMDWIGRAQDRDRWRTLVSAVMNLRVP